MFPIGTELQIDYYENNNRLKKYFLPFLFKNQIESVGTARNAASKFGGPRAIWKRNMPRNRLSLGYSLQETFRPNTNYIKTLIII